MNRCTRSIPNLAISAALLGAPLPALAAGPLCQTRSIEKRTPVIQLYTSEGCSTCPPGDKWLSTLKGKPVVAQAFHVGYQDYIGWVDRLLARDRTRPQLAHQRG
jgi:hypothetical protein